jgi:hypothetical protein
MQKCINKEEQDAGNKSGERAGLKKEAELFVK